MRGGETSQSPLVGASGPANLVPPINSPQNKSQSPLVGASGPAHSELVQVYRYSSSQSPLVGASGPAGQPAERERAHGLPVDQERAIAGYAVGGFAVCAGVGEFGGGF